MATRHSGGDAPSNPTSCTLKIGVFIAAVATSLLLCYRVSIGVDLTDEAYYLSFLDGWLKTGFRYSNALVLHQTAELLVFPFVKIYAAVVPGEQGLALFNRFLYLAASFFSGFCFYRFALTRHTFALSVLAGILVTSFIPFSLPSPSYNTLGMLSMICALSSFATYVDCRRGRWLLTSAVSWMTCVFAYPTLVAVLACFLVTVAAVPSLRGESRRYITWCIAFQILGAVLLLSAYGVNRLEHILAFTNASLQISNGITGKLSKAIALLSSNRTFVCLCTASIVVGIHASRATGRECGKWILVAGVITILVIARLVGPVLYVATHDYIFLLAVAGLAFFTAKGVSGRHIDGTVSALFFVGLFAGLVTSITATNSIINFAVGGFFCTCIFLLSALPSLEDQIRPHLTLLSLVIVLFLSSAFTFVYGEGSNPVGSASAQRVQGGVYANLLTTDVKAQSIAQTTAYLATLKGESIAVIGRLPGIYLLTSMRPKTLSTWDFSQQNGSTPKVESAISSFYAHDSNLPSIILRTTDPWTVPPSSSGQQLLARFVQAAHLDTGLWKIDAFARPARP